MNIYAEVQSLQKSPIDIGGLCQLLYFKWEDVLTWPSPDPVTGIITGAVEMKPGKGMFLCQVADKGRSYDEETTDSSAGPYTHVQVISTLGGNNTANILTLDAMKYSRWGLILKDRGGYMRLIGNADCGAKFNYKHTSGDNTSARKVDLKWTWDYPGGVPIYQSTLFTITIGTITVTTGKLTFIMRFEVGAVGAPMNDGDTLLGPNANFANKNLLVLADGVALPCDDGSGVIDWPSLILRHYKKTLAGNQIEFVGGVVDGEIIEIYAFD